MRARVTVRVQFIAERQTRWFLLDDLLATCSEPRARRRIQSIVRLMAYGSFYTRPRLAESLRNTNKFPKEEARAYFFPFFAKSLVRDATWRLKSESSHHWTRNMSILIPTTGNEISLSMRCLPFFNSDCLRKHDPSSLLSLRTFSLFSYLRNSRLKRWINASSHVLATRFDDFSFVITNERAYLHECRHARSFSFEVE